MEWRISAAGSDGFATISMRGDCDLYAAPAFAADVIARIRAGSKRIRLDFSAVAYLDSSGVGAVIRILQAAKAAQAEIRVRGLSGSPRKVMIMSNVISLLKEDPAEGRPR